MSCEFVISVVSKLPSDIWISYQRFDAAIVETRKDHGEQNAQLLVHLGNDHFLFK